MRSRCGSSTALRLVVLRGWLAGAWSVRLRFGDSAVDGHGVRASVEGGPVRGELADAHGDHGINLLGPAATSTSSYLPPKLASITGTARQTTRHSTGRPGNHWTPGVSPYAQACDSWPSYAVTPRKAGRLQPVIGLLRMGVLVGPAHQG